MTTPDTPMDLTTPTAPGASARAITALVLGLLALAPCCLFFAGIPAILVGQIELAAIRDGSAPTAGQAMARVGCWLGLIGSVLGVLLVAGWFFLIGLGFLAKLLH